MASTAFAPGAWAQDSPGGAAAAIPLGQGGAQLYRQLCQACHQPDGRGGGVVPALAGNAKLADRNHVIDTLLRGRGAMPWFGRTLTAAQVAAVASYVRTAFGNAHADAIGADDVAARSRNLPSESD